MPRTTRCGRDCLPLPTLSQPHLRQGSRRTLAFGTRRTRLQGLDAKHSVRSSLVLDVQQRHWSMGNDISMPSKMTQLVRCSSCLVSAGSIWIPTVHTSTSSMVMAMISASSSERYSCPDLHDECQPQAASLVLGRTAQRLLPCAISRKSQPVAVPVALHLTAHYGIGEKRRYLVAEGAGGI